MPLSNETVPNKPLSGEELKKIILQDITSILDRDGMLQHHLAYGRVAYEVRVTLQLANPYLPEHKVSRKSQDPPKNLPPGDPKKDINAPPLTRKYAKGSVVVGSERERTIDSPNHARIENGLPVTIQRRGEGGRIVEQEVKYDSEDLPDKDAGVTDKDVSGEMADEWGGTAYDGPTETDDPTEGLEVVGVDPGDPAGDRMTVTEVEGGQTEGAKTGTEHPESRTAGDESSPETTENGGEKKSDGESGKADGPGKSAKSKSGSSGQGRKTRRKGSHR